MSQRKIHDASLLAHDLHLAADVVIVGTGAGGGFTAEVLTQAGLSVVMVEAGHYHTAKTIEQNDAWAFRNLFQEGGAQRSKDRDITIVQGRCVGGSTTVNWTTCLPTPARTLGHWREAHGLAAFTEAELEPYLTAARERLHVTDWLEMPPNANNSLLAKGCAALGYETIRVPRNVKGCADSGQCTNGCPINAKQSQLVTTIPAALDAGAQLVCNARVLTVRHDGQRAQGIEAVALTRAGEARPQRIRIDARHIVLAAGAIRTPALLMQSGVPDPSGQTGKRTFLHPSISAWARFSEVVDSFYGAPQTVNCEHFMWPDGLAASGKFGFKLETFSLIPTLAALGAKSLAPGQSDWLRQLPNLHCINALGRDGFHDFEPCGTVELANDGRPVLDYPLTPFLIEGQRHALSQVMDIQFAAGAREARLWHLNSPTFSTAAQARTWLATADLGPQTLIRSSPHVMGGCAMGADERSGVVDAFGRHYALENLSVHDASIFPTSVGVNPQMTIYATALRNSRQLVRALSRH